MYWNATYTRIQPRNLVDRRVIDTFKNVIGVEANFNGVGPHERSREKSLRQPIVIVELDCPQQRDRYFRCPRDIVERQSAPLARLEQFLPRFHANARQQNHCQRRINALLALVVVNADGAYAFQSRYEEIATMSDRQRAPAASA